MVVSACVLNDWTFALCPEGHLCVSVNKSVVRGVPALHSSMNGKRKQLKCLELPQTKDQVLSWLSGIM